MSFSFYDIWTFFWFPAYVEEHSKFFGLTTEQGARCEGNFWQKCSNYNLLIVSRDTAEFVLGNKRTEARNYSTQPLEYKQNSLWTLGIRLGFTGSCQHIQHLGQNPPELPDIWRMESTRTFGGRNLPELPVMWMTESANIVRHVDDGVCQHSPSRG